MSEIRDVYTLSSPMSLPEGVAFDAKTRRFFATGLLGGQITQIDAATGVETLFHQNEGETTPTRPKTLGYSRSSQNETRPPSDEPISPVSARAHDVLSRASRAGLSSCTR